MSTILKADLLSESFYGPAGTQIPVIKNVSFSVDYDELKNKFVTVIAPEGSGKTTLLKILSGIKKPDSGNVFIKDSEMEKRGGVLIPEEPSSFPWFNVYENIEFAGKNFSATKDEIKEIITLVGLEGYEDHTPDNRSFGFRFRISLARALAVNPSLILLDEPFTKMNQLTKKEIYELIIQLSKLKKNNYFLTTSNITEAILLSDKIFLMKKNPGEIFDSVEINFAEERSLSIINNNEFLKFKRLIEKKFHNANIDKFISFSF